MTPCKDITITMIHLSVNTLMWITLTYYSLSTSFKALRSHVLKENPLEFQDKKQKHCLGTHFLASPGINNRNMIGGLCNFPRLLLEQSHFHVQSVFFHSRSKGREEDRRTWERAWCAHKFQFKYNGISWDLFTLWFEICYFQAPVELLTLWVSKHRAKSLFVLQRLIS